MTIARSIILYFAFCLAIFSRAEVRDARIHGRALQYSGYHIELFAYKDYITQEKEVIGMLDVDDNGLFDTKVQLPAGDVTYAFMDLGKYRAYIYLEPGEEYRIVLPPFKRKPDSERFNPYYRQELIEVGIDQERTKLNSAIYRFEGWWQKIYGENIVKIVRKSDKKLADRLIAQCDSVAKSTRCAVDFFKDYVYYRKAQIYTSPRMGDVRRTLNKYYSGHRIAYNVAPYWQTLQMMCPNFISSMTIYTSEKELVHKFLKEDAISFQSLSNVLKRDSAYMMQGLRESLLLMGVYDGYYSQELSEVVVDSMLMSAIKGETTAGTKRVAMNILEKKNHLRKDTPATDFTLLDMKGREVSLKDFSGKWVYLGFFHSESYASVKDMATLDAMVAKYKKDFFIVGVLTDENSDRVTKRFAEKKQQWLPLSSVIQQSILLDYRIAALPSYVLIDPEGRISVAEAPGPTERIEQVIATEMQRYKSNYYRKNKQKEKSIYEIAK